MYTFNFFSSPCGTFKATVKFSVPCRSHVSLTHLVHIEGAKHLFNVSVGLWIETSEPEELLELVER